jgi:hypothetical protein
MNRKERRTIKAPTQYRALEYWELRTIWPIRERGMVIERPTVMTKGEVRSMA